jgi:folate-binding protein YgfZ
LPNLGEEEWRALRVQAGVPEFGAEFTERTIPLEMRQDDHISFTKGCYVGQEVVARLHNYKRVKRALVRLRVAGTEAPAAGSRLFDGERDVGVMTSAANSDHAILALAYVEVAMESPGRHLTIRHGDGSLDAEVLSLHPSGDST